MNCPCCDAKVTQKTLNTKYMDIVGVHECPKCGAVFGECYKGDSYSIVLPYWEMDDPTFDNAFYYDLEVLGSDGVEHRHGWAHRETRRIIQVG